MLLVAMPDDETAGGTVLTRDGFQVRVSERGRVRLGRLQPALEVVPDSGPEPEEPRVVHLGAGGTATSWRSASTGASARSIREPRSASSCSMQRSNWRASRSE